MSWTGNILVSLICAVKVFRIDIVFFADIFNGKFHILGRSLLDCCFCNITTNVLFVIRSFFLVTAIFHRWIVNCYLWVKTYFCFFWTIFLRTLQWRWRIYKLNMDSWLNVTFFDLHWLLEHTFNIKEIKTLLIVFNWPNHSLKKNLRFGKILKIKDGSWIFLHHFISV